MSSAISLVYLDGLPVFLTIRLVCFFSFCGEFVSSAKASTKGVMSSLVFVSVLAMVQRFFQLIFGIF